jgi:hypothetical protein
MLGVSADRTTVMWSRSGPVGEVSSVLFERSADRVTWTALGAAAIVEARIYDDTTDPKWVIALVSITTSSNGGNYTISWNESGIITIS